MRALEDASFVSPLYASLLRTASRCTASERPAKPLAGQMPLFDTT